MSTLHLQSSSMESVVFSYARRTRLAGHRRSAFTLMELMLVLALILAIGAVAVPKFTDLFARQRLQASAEKVRLDFDRARLLAMQTGQAQLFECIIGEDKYSVRPLTQDSDAVNSGAGATLVTQSGAVGSATADGGMVAADTNALSGDVKTLEERVTFLSCTSSEPSSVICFYPDGSTSNAEVRVQNHRGEIRAVRLRGLTGHTKVITVTNVASGDNPQ